MLVATIAAALVLTAASRASAETLACQPPTSPLARLICGDPLLRAADAEENGIYEGALLASLDRSSLREEERAWFGHEILPYNWFAQQHMPIDNSKVIEAYRQRGTALRQEARDWRKLRHGVSGATLANTCLALPQRSGDCTVTAFASIEAAPALRYQQQTYAQPTTSNAIVIFAPVPEEPHDWLPLAVASSHAALTPPQAIVSPNRSLLLIAESGGSGPAALYRLTPDALEDIDDRGWLETLHAHLPDGLALARDITADYAQMQAVSKVTRSQSTCCAVGSTAMIDLAIENDRVVVSGITFGTPEGPPDSNQN